MHFHFAVYSKDHHSFSIEKLLFANVWINSNKRREMRKQKLRTLSIPCTFVHSPSGDYRMAKLPSGHWVNG